MAGSYYHVLIHIWPLCDWASLEQAPSRLQFVKRQGLGFRAVLDRRCPLHVL